MIYSNVRLELVERLNNSVNGNPRFMLRLVDAEGQTVVYAKTSSDASCNYEVTNYTNSKALAVVETTKAGLISTIREYK